MELTPGERASMLDCMRRHYAGVDPSVFERDLAAKDEVLLLQTAEGEVGGFTSLAIWKHPGSNPPCRVIFSGDTIIDRRHWGKLVLEPAWIRMVFRHVDSEPRFSWYWLLICKGPRTYRYLPVYFQNFHPRPTGPDDPSLQALLKELARKRFGPEYDPERGIIHDPGGYWLRPELARLGPRDLANPAVLGFQALNPGWRKGDELATLTPLRRENLRPILRRWLDASNENSAPAAHKSP